MSMQVPFDDLLHFFIFKCALWIFSFHIVERVNYTSSSDGIVRSTLISTWLAPALVRRQIMALLVYQTITQRIRSEVLALQQTRMRGLGNHWSYSWSWWPTNGNPIMKQGHFAYCQGDQYWLHKHLAMQRFKQRSSSANPSHSENWRLLAEELDSMYPDLINQVGTRRQLQHIAHYHHRRNQPKIRKLAAYQTFPGEYSLTRDSQQFLLYNWIENHWLPSDDEYEVFSNPEGLIELLGDEVLESQTIVFAAFGIERDFEILAEATDVSADATFNICPRPYRQYFTMHTKFGNRSFPRLRVIKLFAM